MHNGPTRILRHEALPFAAVKEGADKTYAVRPHFHDTLSLGFVESGSSTVDCHPLALTLSAGDIILIPPGTVHLCRPRSGQKFRFRMIYVEPGAISSHAGVDPHRLMPGLLQPPRETRQEAARFFDAFSDGPNRSQTRALDLIAGLIRSGEKARSAPPKGPMNRIRQVLDHSFAEEMPLDKMARLAGTSKYTLVRQFKKQWRITPHAYQVNQRINHAKHLLRQGSSVADAAAETGFFDQSHFVKTFKNLVGLCPADYIR